MATDGQRKSQLHEKRLANKYEGTTNAGSGSFWKRKGDVRAERFVFEHKYTGALKSLSIKAEWLKTITNIGLMEGKIPVLAFHLAGRNYIVLNEDDFDELVERAYDDEVVEPGEV